MVLHNTKWDKKATKRYLKKHGIVAKDIAKCEETQRSPVTTQTWQNNVPHASEVPQELDVSEATEFPAEEHTGGVVDVIDLPDYEEDEEQEKLIRAHIARQTYSASPNATPVADKSIFEKAEAGYERSKLNQAVRKHIGRQAKNIDMDSDSDFEKFMDELSDSEVNEAKPTVHMKSSIEISGGQQQLLDKLLN